MGGRLTGRAFGVAAMRTMVGAAAAFRAAAIAAALLLGATAAHAAGPTVEVSTDQGHARIIVDFADRNVLPGHRVTADSGVLVMQFDEAVAIDATRVAASLVGYVIIARDDPDGRGARFALARGVTMNAMEAGPRLFVDLLPPGWRGPPPGLPPSVVADLAKRAEEAEKLARQAEMLRIAGAAGARLDIRSARGPTFSRFVFKWNIPFEASFERRNTGLVVTFNRSAPVDLAPIRAELPPFVNEISSSLTETGGLSFLLEVDDTSDARAFREGDTYVVDVQGATTGGAPAAPEVALIQTATSPADGIPAEATGRVQAPGVEQVVMPPADPEPAPEPAVAMPAPASPAPSAPAPVVAAPDAPPPVAAVPELSDDTDQRVLADGVIRVEAKRIGQATRMVFPYDHEVGSALFTRGAALWLVFDDPAPIEVGPLQDALAGYARSIDVFPAENAQVVRIEMVEPLLATLNPDSTYWVVTIGNMMIEPTRPLALRRVTGEDGATHFEVPFGPVSAVHDIRDPATGDSVLVVTGTGQPRGLIKPQHFAELDALSSAYGLAFVPFVDDLRVTVDGLLVSVGRPAGLSVSSGQAKSRRILDLPGAGLEETKRKGQIDFTGSLAVDPVDFWRIRHDLATRVAAAQDHEEAVAAWYDTAKFHIANSFGAEALGVLSLIAANNNDEATSDRMAVMRAGAEALMGRPAETLRLLERSELAESPDASVWRAIALTDLHDFAAAHRAIARGATVIDSFPETVRRRFLLSAIRTAIELNDFGTARSVMAELDPAELGPREISELDLLNARAIDANGHPGEAVALLSNVVRTGRGAPSAEATYRLVRIQRREGLITLDQAIARLEQLAVSWRGDQIELDVLRALSQLSIENGNYRRAFEVTRTAMQVAPNADTTRLMSDEMQGAFASLFLDGGADAMKPIDALALYYDFRELTPPGRRGDAMVRRLADRLVDVDLLPQAAELLGYQVENRLHGAARAEVAADLAVVHLMDRRPDRALMAIARTRQPELPLSVERQRRVVEGRALAETGKVDLALDLLKPLKGADIDRLRAEILWNANRNQKAGEQFERLLAGRWADDLPLTDAEQLEVLKAGISYTLADDRLSLDRLRSAFARKMALTANAVAFDAVTAPVSTAGVSFDEVVRSIAALDQAQAFLADYRTRFRPGDDTAAPEDPAAVSSDTISADPVSG